MKDAVVTKYIDSYEIDKLANAFRESFASLNVFDALRPKMKVLIKVCLPSSTNADKAQTTNPNLVLALIKVLNEMNIECVIADSPMKGYSQAALDELYVNTGMLSMANLTKCELNHNLKTCVLSTPQGVRTKSLTIMKIANEVDAIINFGKVKTNKELGYLGAVSNLFGLVPGKLKEEILNRTGTQKDFSNFCLDIFDAVKGKLYLNILDAVVTLEADESERLLYCLAMSKNIFNLDSVMLDILELDKSKSVLKQAENRQLFDLNDKIRVLGDGVDRFKLEDYNRIDLDDNKKLHKNKSGVSSRFNLNQQRVVIGKTCKGCSICSKICPTGAIQMKYDKNGELFAHVDYSKCIFCYKCHTACPYSVVKLKTPPKYKRIHAKIEKYNNETNDK